MSNINLVYVSSANRQIEQEYYTKHEVTNCRVHGPNVQEKISDYRHASYTTFIFAIYEVCLKKNVSQTITDGSL